MIFNDENIKDLACRIYDLDTEVYTCLGSDLGRVFSTDKNRSVGIIMEELHSSDDGTHVRGELALISNMARTIPDKKLRHDIMVKYDQIIQDVMDLPFSSKERDILDPKIADLNTLNLKERFSSNDNMIICIGRSCGCGGNEIGFGLADKLQMNFYDVSVMNEVFRQQGGEDALHAQETFEKAKVTSPVKGIKKFGKYHGLGEEDVVFFNTSKFLVEKAKKENFVVMGRFADAILTNNHIPHISIFITAPIRRRIERMVKINPQLTVKQAKKLIEKEDARHLKKYKFYTGRKWSNAANYDLCINSASYGIDGSIEMIMRMLKLEGKVE